MVIGNSSSGILEAPSFKIPTVNIGDRQLGRVRAKSVIDCENDVDSIITAIEQAGKLKEEGVLEKTENPYEKADTSENILFALKRYMMNGASIKKTFYDIPFESKQRE